MYKRQTKGRSKHLVKEIDHEVLIACVEGGHGAVDRLRIKTAAKFIFVKCAPQVFDNKFNTGKMSDGIAEWIIGGNVDFMSAVVGVVKLKESLDAVYQGGGISFVCRSDKGFENERMKVLCRPALYFDFFASCTCRLYTSQPHHKH